MNNKRVLVVWNEIPEKVSFLNLTVSDEEEKLLRSFHKQFVNSTGNPELLDRINEFFYDETGYLRFKEEEGPLVGQVYDLVIQTGIYL